MREKIVALDDALVGCRDGMSIGLGGATLRRKPIALVRALVARGVRDLSVAVWLGSLDVDLLLQAGAIRRLDAAYVGFGPLGLSNLMKEASVRGDIEFRDFSESSFIAALRAGTQGAPFALTRAILGTSLGEGFAREIESPFDGTRVMAVPSIRPDVVLLHAQAADQYGNVYRQRPNATDDIDHIWALAGDHVVVSAEEIVTRGSEWSRDDVVIPGRYVAAVVHAPGGALPTSCDGRYPSDLAALAGHLQATKAGPATTQTGGAS